MLANIQAVVFDLDGTLLDRRRSFERFVRNQWERFGHFVRTVDQEKYVQILIERDRDGYAPRKELFTGLIAQFELPSSVASQKFVVAPRTARRPDGKARRPSIPGVCEGGATPQARM